MSALASITFLAALASPIVGAAVVEPRWWDKSPAPYWANLTSCVGENIAYSCENTTAIKNTCCTPTPGGLVLQTQFWDTYTGLEDRGQLLPDKSWTIHGLWPDYCNGSYTQYCDLSRQYDPSPSPNVSNGQPVPAYKGPGVDTFVKKLGRYDLLKYMKKFWVNQGDTNEVFWAHEFSKHATCFSNYDVACYGPNYKEHQDVVDFFENVVRVYQMYPTYNLLASAGVVPSNQTTYNITTLQTAMKSLTGAVPYFGCSGASVNNTDGTIDGRTVLSEVWYFNHVLGTTQYGNYKHIDSTSKSNCAKNHGIHYYERTPSAVSSNDY